MNKKVKKLFVARETLIDLTPYLKSQAQGALCANSLCGTVTNDSLTNMPLKTMDGCCYVTRGEDPTGPCPTGTCP